MYRLFWKSLSKKDVLYTMRRDGDFFLPGSGEGEIFLGHFFAKKAPCFIHHRKGSDSEHQHGPFRGFLLQCAILRGCIIFGDSHRYNVYIYMYIYIHDLDSIHFLHVLNVLFFFHIGCDSMLWRDNPS